MDPTATDDATKRREQGEEGPPAMLPNGDSHGGSHDDDDTHDNNKQESAPDNTSLVNGRGASVTFANLEDDDDDDDYDDLDREHNAIASGSGDPPEEANAMTSGVLDSTAVTSSTSRRRGSSLELRRLPVNVLLRPEESKLFDEDLSVDEGDNFEQQTRKHSWLQQACLNSKFTLRSQMMLSFGVISTCTILMVVIVCIVVSVVSGEVVKSKAKETTDDLAAVLEGRAVRYIAEDLSPRIMNDDVIRLMHQAVQDRFYGYPQYLNDSMVPYLDTITGERKFPIAGQPMPMEWETEDMVNPENEHEHLQGRYSWFGGSNVSTAHGGYFQQGACDPAAHPGEDTYFFNCTNANNDITTGGIYAPTPTNQHVYRKASDLIPMFKSLFEYHTDLKGVNAIFVNGGAGGVLAFPSFPLPGGTQYTSIGCEWLRRPNPMDPSKQLLSDEDIERCEWSGSLHRVEGAKIPLRQYTGLDRGFLKRFVLNNGTLTLDGPYADAWSDSWLITIGRSVHDKITKELIGILAIDLVVGSSLQDIVMNSTISANSAVSVVAFDKVGTVTLSSAWDTSSANFSIAISELDVGVSQSSYQQFRSLVDYNDKSTAWDPTEVRETYENFTITEDGFEVKAYPIPPVPEEYDPNYRPSFLVLFSANQYDVYAAARNSEETVDAKVSSLIILSVIVGAVGLGVVFIVLFAVSNFITLPLRRMNETAMRIIDGFGGGGEDTKIDVENTVPAGQLVETELSQIVKEFQRMVRKFSGGAMANKAKASITEVDNQFQLMKEYGALYASRSEPGFKFKVDEARVEQGEEADTVSTPASRVHFGSNIIASGASTVKTSLTIWDSNSRSRWFSSPLFRWIVGLIVIPLLLSTVTISTIVTVTVSQELPEMVIVAEQGLISLQLSALRAFASLRAGYVAKSNEKPIRDVHVLTRFASWLLFGGLEIAAFPEMLEPGTDQCKYYTDIEDCPYLQENYFCSCEWRYDFSSRNCTDYEFDTRPLQKNFFVGSSQDVSPNGDRLSTSFPLVANLPNTTAWWRSVDEVPGSPSRPINGTESWSNAPPSTGRYVTPYGRLRSVAASPVSMPLFNYDLKAQMYLNNYVAFEADGMWVAYRGCGNPYHAGAFGFQSEIWNRAYEIRPELCPKEKWGYDPRCRGWYADTRRAYETTGTPAHVTPPYVFSGGEYIGQSCTGIIEDPNTKDFVGETLIDFESRRMFEVLSSNRTPLATGGFHVLIATQEDAGGGDGIIGPNHTVKDSALPIEVIIDARDDSCEDADCGFAKILKSMRAGEAGDGTFTWQGPSGPPITMHIAYRPVVVKMFHQVNASDFARGAEQINHTLYSVALAEPEASLLVPFEQAEEDIEKVIHVGVALLALLIVLASILVVFLSHRITVSMTEPMRYLLELIRQINRLDVGEEAPTYDMHGAYGSSEVLHVRLTMERLYKIIQCANAAYFAGETDVAFEVFTDALRLFTRLDNKKAMGVASNNLGNTMLTVFRTMEATGEDTSLGMTRRQIIGKGMSYFHQAIQLGEQAYDNFYETEGWGPNCLHFMQHLSNRYFNRAMFLLTVKDHHEKPKEIEELGLRDLQITRDMDVEIVDEGTQVGWDVRSAEAHFEVLLSRIRGHISLLEMGYPDDWEVDEMLENAFKIIQAELKKDDNVLFMDIGPAGRMQQLEHELMRYYIVDNDIPMAAKIAIRMMVEDEFVIPEAQRKAVEVLERYSALPASNIAPEAQRRLKMYQRWLEDACDELDTQRSSRDAFSVEKDHLSLRNSIISRTSRNNDSGFFDDNSTKGERSEKTTNYSVASLRQSMRGDLTMEAF